MNETTTIGAASADPAQGNPTRVDPARDAPPGQRATAVAHDVPMDQLRAAADQASAQPRRRPGLPARALFPALDMLYGRQSTLDKFRVLEVVARVPYQAWEQVAFVAITHTHDDPSFARGVHSRVEEARRQQDNELFHLLILEEMLDRENVRRTLWRGRLLPQVIAFVYYHLSWMLFVIRPRWSYRLNADFEDHAMHTYLAFVNDHPEFESQKWETIFASQYGPTETVADLFRSIALDEQSHRDESIALIDHARFNAASEDR